jgi:hypothetical protein
LPVIEAIDPETIHLVSRALVYLTVDWSAPERVARRAFFETVEKLSKDHTALGIVFYSLNEENMTTRDFLASLGFNVKYTRGCGSLIWLESGRRVAYAVAGHLLGTAGIIERTLALWSGRNLR